MHVTRRRILIAGAGCVAAGTRLFGQGPERPFSLSPIDLRGENTLRVAMFVTAPCQMEITLTGREPLRRTLKAEETFSQLIDGIGGIPKLQRTITMTPTGPTVPRFTVIFEPGGKSPSRTLEDKARRAQFIPQPVQPVHNDGNFLVNLESPANVSVQVRRMGASAIVRSYGVSDRPQGSDVPIPWDLRDDNKRRVGQGQYVADLTLQWKNGLSPQYVVGSVQVDG